METSDTKMAMSFSNSVQKFQRKLLTVPTSFSNSVQKCQRPSLTLCKTFVSIEATTQGNEATLVLAKLGKYNYL